MVKKKKNIIGLIIRWLIRRLYFGLKRIESIKKSINSKRKRGRYYLAHKRKKRKIGNLGLKFDKHFFRPLDIIRVFLKRVFTRLHLRDTPSCNHCGRDQHVVWSIEDKAWNKLPVKYHNKSLCIECFIELYPKKLKTLHFTFGGFCR